MSIIKAERATVRFFDGLPFGGSGTAGVACEELGRKYILIEREPEFVAIARARIAHVSPWDHVNPQPNPEAPPPRIQQLSLF